MVVSSSLLSSSPSSSSRWVVGVLWLLVPARINSYRLGFSTQVLKLSSGELGKIAAAVVVALAGILTTKTLCDQ